MSTSAERQRKFRARVYAESGLRQVTLLVPEEHMAALKMVGQMLCEDRNLEPGPLRNVKTGRLVKVER